MLNVRDEKSKFELRAIHLNIRTIDWATVLQIEWVVGNKLTVALFGARQAMLPFINGLNGNSEMDSIHYINIITKQTPIHTF